MNSATLLRELQPLCDFATAEMADHILSIPQQVELEEYLAGMLGDSPAVMALMKRLSKRFEAPPPRSKPAPAVAPPPAPPVAPAGTRLYRKGDDDDDDGVVAGADRRRRGPGKPASNEEEVVRQTPGGFVTGLSVKVIHSEAVVEEAAAPSSSAKASAAPVVAESVKTVGILADASRHCSCQATLHKLLCNCLSCGKIVCELEAGHTCTFCGSVLSISGMGKKAMANAKKRAQLQSQEALLLLGVPESSVGDETLQRAIAHKDRLLLFDKTSAQRSVVLDDQADYFTTSSAMWLSDAERAAAVKADDERRDQRHNGRSKIKLAFDFSGRTVAVTDQSEPSAHALGRRIGKTAPPSASAPAVAPPATALVAEGLFLGAGAGAGHMAAVAGPSSEPSSYAPNTALTGGASAVYAAVMADRAGRPANLKKPAPEGWLSSRVQHSFSLEADGVAEELIAAAGAATPSPLVSQYGPDVFGDEEAFPDRNEDNWWDFPGYG